MLRQCLRPHNTRLPPRPSFLRAAVRRHASSATPPKAQSQPSLRSRLYTSIDRSGIPPFLRWGLGVFLSYHIFTSYFFAFSPCDGISMLPTLNSCGDWVLISKYYRRGRGVTVGDLVSFYHPVDEGVEGVKRVVGLEGDFVLMDSPGTDGKMIQVRQFNYCRSRNRNRDTCLEYYRGSDLLTNTRTQIPQGHCWLVGDNLKFSRDSRLFGPLPLALIRGKIIARYTHWTSLQWMRNGLQNAADEDDVD